MIPSGASVNGVRWWFWLAQDSHQESLKFMNDTHVQIEYVAFTYVHQCMIACHLFCFPVDTSLSLVAGCQWQQTDKQTDNCQLLKTTQEEAMCTQT